MPPDNIGGAAAELDVPDGRHAWLDPSWRTRPRAGRRRRAGGAVGDLGPAGFPPAAHRLSGPGTSRGAHPNQHVLNASEYSVFRNSARQNCILGGASTAKSVAAQSVPVGVGAHRHPRGTAPPVSNPEISTAAIEFDQPRKRFAMIDCICRFRFVWREGRRVDATVAEGVCASRGRRRAVWSPRGGRGLPRRAAQTGPHRSRPVTEVTGRPWREFYLCTRCA